jgi:hypothetical protein
MTTERTMKLGVHLIERGKLPLLSAVGVDVPPPWMGILDVLRMVEGHLPEPPEKQPLGIVGVEAIVRTAPDATKVLQALRAGLLEARRYFGWKEIPLVFLPDARVDDASDGNGLVLELGARRCSLAPLLGTRLTPVREKSDGWWWAPQIG